MLEDEHAYIASKHVSASSYINNTKNKNRLLENTKALKDLKCCQIQKVFGEIIKNVVLLWPSFSYFSYVCIIKQHDLLNT